MYLNFLMSSFFSIYFVFLNIIILGYLSPFTIFDSQKTIKKKTKKNVFKACIFIIIIFVISFIGYKIYLLNSLHFLLIVLHKYILIF